MRRTLVILLLALTVCRSKVTKEGVRVDVTNKSNAEIVQLKVTATGSVGSEDLWLPADSSSMSSHQLVEQSVRRHIRRATATTSAATWAL